MAIPKQPREATTRASRTYAGENMVDRVARRRAQFMDAGLQVFGTRGYRSATVRMLCKEAGLTDRYFYESFATTEDLLIAVYQRQLDQLQQALISQFLNMPADADVMVAVRAGLAALFAMAAEPRVARVCWREILGVSPRVDATYLSALAGFADLVIGFARLRMPGWQVGDDEARMLGLALIGAVTQTAMHWVLGDYRESRDTLIAVNLRVFEGALASIRADARA